MKLKKLLLTTLPLSIAIVPLVAASCDNTNNNGSNTKIKDLTPQQQSAVFSNFQIVVKPENKLTFNEFKVLFTQKYNSYNNDIYKVAQDPEIQKSVRLQLMDKSKLQNGHRLEIQPEFVNQTEQFKLQISIFHIQGNYREGQAVVNQSGNFELVSSHEIEEESQKFNYYVNDTIFEKENSTVTFEQAINKMLEIKNNNWSLSDQVIIFKPSLSIDFGVNSKFAIKFSYDVDTENKNINLTATLILKKNPNQNLNVSSSKNLHFE
ncbi:variable surface lipoprotein [[Mycoplasma] gypis]|uniref:Variable surface lipoprotein n=1 Tax=[Mycoplasma] gypis TaxID=92404 RepID=A0ABZ2RN01_9BACT|nr:variable surface lipoprotein [[Mycoplasma] gypis]MBN0919483.1 variable surface lipoprotein [[Mycoplasma] gypis]